MASYLSTAMQMKIPDSRHTKQVFLLYELRNEERYFEAGKVQKRRVGKRCMKQQERSEEVRKHSPLGFLLDPLRQ